MPSSVNGAGAARPTLNTAARQSQSMSPRLQQAVRLLLMSAQEYEQAMQEWVLRNPFLEIKENGLDRQDVAFAALADPTETAEQPADPAPAYELDTLGGWDEGEPWSEAIPGLRSGMEPAGTSAIELAQSDISLRQHLHAQAATLPLSLRDRVLIDFVIESLDDDGYLRCDLLELAQQAGFSPPVLATELNTALRLVQSFDPVGVGARDLVECLLLQVAANGPASHDVVRTLILQHLECLARGDAKRVARLAGMSLPQVEAGWKAIRQLDPWPGRRFEKAPVHYVRPDAVVYRSGRRWAVRLNSALLPRISVNQTYAELFEQHRNAGHGRLAAHLQEARWLVRNLRQRCATILAVAQAIVQRQQGYFDNGPLAMRPMALQEIAQDVGVHESTVSRVTNGKYLQTPHGPIELKKFFSRPMPLASGGVCSPMAIRCLVQEIIAAENALDPLSDVQITERLARQGLQVARRTVTKYRQMLKLPSVDQRRSTASREAETGL